MLTTTMGICYGFSAISYLFRLQPPHAGNYMKQLMFHYRRTHTTRSKKMINYNKLYYFYIITSSNSLTEAASKLHLSQPALSKSIHDLEADFNVELFKKKGRTLELTHAGHVLHEECFKLFKDEDYLLMRIKHASATTQETINFGYMIYNELFRITPILSEFAIKEPSILVNATPYYERDEVTNQLLSGKLDVGLKIFNKEDVSPELDYYTLGESHLFAVTYEGHPLTTRKSIHLSELKNEQFILIGDDEYATEVNEVRDLCRKSGFEPKIAYQSGNNNSVLFMVQSGAGISIQSGFAPIDQMKGLIAVPLENSPIIYSGLFWKKNDHRGAVHKFIEYYIHSRSNLSE